MATTRSKATAKQAPAEAVEEHDDGAPSFTTSEAKVVYDGPVLMRIDGVAYRMRRDRTFAGSLLYLRRLRNSGLRDAELALVDHVAGVAATNKLVMAAELEPDTWRPVILRALNHVLGKDPEDEEGN